VKVADSLRIAVYLPTFPELSNAFIVNQIIGLIDRGHDVDLFARSAKSFENAHDVVHRYALSDRMRHIVVPSARLARIGSVARLLATRHGWHPAALDALNPFVDVRESLRMVGFHTAVSFLRAQRYDVVHAQFGHHGSRLSRLRRRGAIDAAIVTSFRGADLTVHVSRDVRRFAELFRTGDLFLPVSSEFHRRLVALGVPEQRIRVLRSGIDVDRFAFAPRQRSNGRTTLMCVGRLTEKKGFAYAVDALAMLHARGHDVDLVIIGDGPLLGSLRSRAAALGVADRVTFHGPRTHASVVATMHAAHILVAPSVTAATGDQEGIPNVLKEAMATGMPVVSTTHSGISELVEHGVNGLLAPEHDVEALTTHLEALLHHPEGWGAMGAAGRRKVENEYDMEPLNDDLVRNYRAAMTTYRARTTPSAG